MPDTAVRQTAGASAKSSVRPRLIGLGLVGLGLIALIPAAFVGVFFVYPVLTVVVNGLAGVPDILGSTTHLNVIWFTFWQAALSTILTLVVGLPAAAMLARLRPSARRLLRAAVAVPFVLPTVVVASALDTTFERVGLSGANSLVSFHHTVWAILIAHMFFNYAVVVRVVGSWWAGLDRRVADAAAALGAKPHQVLANITWPMLRPAVAVAAAITFLFSFTSFGVILILGGPTAATLETEIYRFAITRIDFDTAAALALIQLVAVAALVTLTTRFERRYSLARRPAGQAHIPRNRRLTVLNAAVMALLLGLPIAILCEQAFRTSGGYSFANFTRLTERVDLLPVSAATALGNSLLFAVVATVIATVVGVSAAVVAVRGERPFAKAFDVVLTLPLGVSAVTVGIGILLALDQPPLDLRTSRWIIPLTHALVGLPFVVRSVVPTLRSIDQRLREAASVLGAAPSRIWREIDLPIVSRAVAVGAAFAFAISLGEFGATAFLPRGGDTLTAPLVLFRLLGTPGEILRGQAQALAVVLMVITAAAVLLIERLRRTDEGVF